MWGEVMKKKIIISLILFIILISIGCVNATEIDLEKYKDVGEIVDDELFENMGGQTLWIVQAIGYAVSIISLTIIGIKYMLASADEKADLKKRLAPFIFGALLLFASSFIMTIIVQFTQEAI